MGLQISRTEGERVFIGDNIIVKVVSNKRGRVILDFMAPPDVPIHREEIYRETHGLDEDDECDT